jgi:hypothetical protein
VKPIETEIEKIERHGRDREDKGADQKRAGRPVDAIKGNARKHEA